MKPSQNNAYNAQSSTVTAIVMCVAALLLGACSGSSDTTAPATSTANAPQGSPMPSNPDNEQPGVDNPTTDNGDNSVTRARYRLRFEASWSDTTHPLNFPNNPHFSGLVGAVHNEQVRFWEPGQMATDGIQQMAETGNKSDLRLEVQAAIDNGSALMLIDGGGVASSPGTVSIDFEVSQDFPQITVTSMLAPSPDWFIGLHNHSLLVNGNFMGSHSIELVLYDAGSDSGARYSSPNETTSPLSPIARVNSEAQDTPFINGEPTVGVFIIERLDN